MRHTLSDEILMAVAVWIELANDFAAGRTSNSVSYSQNATVNHSSFKSFTRSIFNCDADVWAARFLTLIL